MGRKLYHLRFKKMFCRFRFFKRIFFTIVVSAIFYCVIVLLFGDPRVVEYSILTELNRCPACFGISACSALYSGRVTLDLGLSEWRTWAVNTKNVYYGYTQSNRKLVLKKLASNTEFSQFDKNFCKEWNLKENCKASDVYDQVHEDVIKKKMLQLVKWNLTSHEMKPRTRLIFCPYTEGFFNVLKPFLNENSKSYKMDLINIWTMLSLNPEPILLQILPKSMGWPVAEFGGCCGRLEVTTHQGQPLYMFNNVSWAKKLAIAINIINAAMDFTFKHKRYRVYLMDWSIDNIVVNEKNEVSFIDLEDIIIVDTGTPAQGKHTTHKEIPDWHRKHISLISESKEYAFSIDDICKHDLSDHNLWSACFILGYDSYSPFLVDIRKVKSRDDANTRLERLLFDCLHGDPSNNDNNFERLKEIKEHLKSQLQTITTKESGEKLSLR